jgi:hypothetical protein
MAKHLMTDDDILAQVPAARQRARRARLTHPHAAAVRFERAGRRLHVQLTNGAALVIPVELIASLRDATDQDLATVSVGAAGIGLRWEGLDQDLTIAGLAKVALGSRVLLRASGSVGGAARTPAKIRAARRNGRKGGRPRKVAL